MNCSTCTCTCMHLCIIYTHVRHYTCALPLTTESGESDVEDAQDCLYFAGNSLGLQPKCANDLVQARDREKREYLTPVYLPVKALFEVHVQSTLIWQGITADHNIDYIIYGVTLDKFRINDPVPHMINIAHIFLCV